MVFLSLLGKLSSCLSYYIVSMSNKILNISQLYTFFVQRKNLTIIKYWILDRNSFYACKINDNHWTFEENRKRLEELERDVNQKKREVENLQQKIYNQPIYSYDDDDGDCILL